MESNDKSLNNKLTQIASESSYEYGIKSGEYRETELTKLLFDVIKELNK